MPREGSPEGDRDARALARRAFIEERAAALGRTWAEGCRRALHDEGRPAAGGWPGTLREARLRVANALLVDVKGGTKSFAITEAERELAVQTAYASARSEWRRHADPEPR